MKKISALVLRGQRAQGQEMKYAGCGEKCSLSGSGKLIAKYSAGMASLDNLDMKCLAGCIARIRVFANHTSAMG